MPLIEIPIPTLVRGVSQQAPVVRLPGQAQVLDNGFPSPITGLTKRHPTQHVAKLVDGYAFPTAVHTIDRDEDERYKVLLEPHRLRVFDVTDGSEITAVPSSSFGSSYASALDTRSANQLGSPEAFASSPWTYGGDWEVTGLPVSESTGVQGPFRFGTGLTFFNDGADTLYAIGTGASATGSDSMNIAAGFFPVSTVDTTMSLYLKRPSDTVAAANGKTAAEDIRIYVIDFSNSVNHYADFSISAGGVITVSSSTTGVTAVATLFRDGWYRVELRMRVATLPTTTAGAQRRVRIEGNQSSGPAADWMCLAWGAHLDDFAPTAPAYFVTGDDALRLLTVADFTFIVNKQTTTAMSSASVTPPDERGFVFVRSGGFPDTHYKVTVKLAGFSERTAEYTTDDEFTAPITNGGKTDTDIADSLQTTLDAFGELTVTRVGSVIQIVPNPTSGTFEYLRVEDSRGDTMMTAFTDSITKFTDLPLICFDQHIVKVQGEPERELDDYFVKFVSQESGAVNEGFWEETADPSLQHAIDQTTMPLKLVRMQDDTTGTITGTANARYFELDYVDWNDRLVGDETSNSQPSFIGQALGDIFFHRNRLGFLAGDNIILSQVGEFFNFWQQSAQQLVDDDPIDIAAGSRSVALLHHAIPFSEELMVFSSRSQFLLTGDPILTPSTAQLVPVRSFENQAQIAPIDSGRGVFFSDRRGDYSGVWEASQQGDSLNFDADDLTVHTPKFILGRALEMTTHTPIGATVLRADGDRSVLYLHKSLWEINERLQSAWARFTFGSGATVEEVAFIEENLYLVVSRAEGVFLERMEITEDLTEASQDWITYLDRRIDQDSSGYSASYSGATDKTTFTLPYDIESGETMVVVDKASGLIVPLVSSTSNTLVVSGDFSSSSVFIGQQYEMRFTFSEPFVQVPSGRSRTPRVGHPLSLKFLHIAHADSAFYEVQVTGPDGASATTEYSAPDLGTLEFGMGTLRLEDGNLEVAIIGEASEMTVSIVNDTPYPSTLQSAAWEAQYYTRARSI